MAKKFLFVFKFIIDRRFTCFTIIVTITTVVTEKNSSTHPKLNKDR